MATRTITRTKTNTTKVQKTKVNNTSVAFTDSEDSDPEFINGASYTDEPKKKKRQITANSSKHLRKLRVGNSTFLCGDNPLKQWLGSDLDVNSAPESDANFSDDEDWKTRSSPPGNSRQEKPRSPSTVNKSPAKSSQGVVSIKRESTPNIQEDDSMTEPESDNENAFATLVASPMIHVASLKSKAPSVPADESATEPESDEDMVLASKRKAPNSLSPRPTKKAKIIPPTYDDDSVTEPDSDDEMSVVPSQANKHETTDPNAPPLPVKRSCQPLPAFKPTASQPDVGPLVLDKHRGIQVAASINRWLRDYQREGVEFFYERYKEGRGGILGDDMGLGKTIQVISFLSAIMKKTGDNRDRNRRQEHVEALQDSSEWLDTRKLPPANATWPTCLIIAPASVVHNWERELETWGYFEVGIYTGKREERAAVLKDFEFGRLDILVMSVDLALRDCALLESQAWSCIFVDEVHRVKNPQSKASKAFNNFDCEVRFGLTGTAIQNNLGELWTILDWSNPGRVGTAAQWKGWVTKPLSQGQSSNATHEQVATGRIVAERLVNRLLPNFFKRRTKDIIAHQLPKKFDQVVFCPLTEVQKKVYKRFLATHEVQVMLKKDELCSCGSGKLGKKCHLQEWDKKWMFQNIVILIKISNHLALILPAPIDTSEQTIRHRQQANIGWPPVNGVPTAPSYGEAVFDPRLCGKWKVLKDLLTTWHNEGDNKVLIFTKSVKLLEMLEQRLKEAFMEFRKLDGSVKQKDRMPLIDQFNDDPKVFVFLISIMAGGVGLNLTGANKVVIFDPSWNPANDLQAMDRAYRFGQRRDVSVYRLLGAGSLEELIYKRQIYKQQQMKIGYEASHQTRYFEGVQGDKTKQGDLFGLKNIFTLDEAGTTTKHTIEKSHLAQLDWALANLDGKSAPEEGVAFDAIAEKTKSEPGMKGLGALFFGTGDEAMPQQSQPEAENDIVKILNSNGVRYTHHNDALLKPSTIETKLTTKAIEGKKERGKAAKGARRGKGADKQSEIPWPPKRKHHKSQAPRKLRLSERMDALIDLGHISAPSDLSRFAEDFLKKSEEEQTRFLGELDEEYMRAEDD